MSDLIFDNLSFGDHFENESGSKFIKIFHYGGLPRTYEGSAFNAIDYRGMPFYFNFSDKVIFPRGDIRKTLGDFIKSHTKEQLCKELENRTVLQSISDSFISTEGLDNRKTTDIITQDLNKSPNENNNSKTDNTMNTNTAAVITVPQLTLTEAVTNAINTLKSRGQMSAYEITSTIRSSVNAGEYEIPSLITSGANIKYWVNHSDVKDIIETMLNDNSLTALGLTNVNFNGSYRVFEFANNPTPTPVADTNVTTDDNTTSVTTATTHLVPAASSVLVGTVNQKISNYLKNQSGNIVTLKKIQSAIKVNGYHCYDIGNIVASLGYSVTPGSSNCFSTYTVKA